jgi:hypothetical protein
MQVHYKCIETCGIHAGYMYPQRKSRYWLGTCEINMGYMRIACGIGDTYLTLTYL